MEDVILVETDFSFFASPISRRYPRVLMFGSQRNDRIIFSNSFGKFWLTGLHEMPAVVLDAVGERSCTIEVLAYDPALLANECAVPIGVFTPIDIMIVSPDQCQQECKDNRESDRVQSHGQR